MCDDGNVDNNIVGQCIEESKKNNYDATRVTRDIFS